MTSAPRVELAFSVIGMAAFMAIMIWTGIAWFDPDPFHELPVEIGDQP